MHIARRAAILDGLIKRSPQLARHPVAEPRPAEPVRARKCLIVDDSRVIRKVARGILESLGYGVTEAENGEEALAKCKHAMPDLILLDWNMPVMSGVEFVSSLRALQVERKPKVVFCTSNADENHIRKGIEAGADEYVIKPFDRQILQAKLERIGAA